MKEPFHFKDDLYSYSVDRLIELCKDPKNHDTAFNHIREGNIEKWLNYIGEVELCNIVNRIRTDNCYKQVQHLIDELSEHLNNRKFIQSLDIDKAIEITLKEYETLRAEILQNMQERNQLIGLGLAAIFTVAGFGLAPLAGFFTVEEISVKTPIDFQQIYDKINHPNNFEIGEFIVDYRQNIRKDPIDDIYKIIDKPVGKLTIERTTKGDTINNRGIIPSVVIFSWLIPIINVYIIFRLLELTHSISVLGEYINLRIEKRLVNLTKWKLKFLDIKVCDNFRVYGTPLLWETFVKNQHFTTMGKRDYWTILIAFGGIVCVSLLGGIFLLLFDFDEIKFRFVNPIFCFIFILLPLVIFFICYCKVKDQANEISNIRKKVENYLSYNNSQNKIKEILDDMWDN